MNIGLFSDFDEKDQAAWQQWNLAHLISHQTQHIAFTDLGTALQNPPLDFYRNDATWLELHQAVHRWQFDVLGLTVLPNFSDVDWTNEDEFRDWHLQHALVHQVINVALSIN